MSARATPCEACGREPAYSFSYDRPTHRWRVTGTCTSDTEHYYVTWDRWLTEDTWLVHLREKVWFDEADFRAAVARVPGQRMRRALDRQIARYPAVHVSRPPGTP